MSLPSGLWELHGPRRFKDRFYPEIVLSARLDIRRNFASIRFTSHLSETSRNELSQHISSLLKESPWFEHAFSIHNSNVTPAEAAFLRERQYCEPDLIQRIGSKLTISEDTRVTVQSCATDHLHWSAVGQGVAFRKLRENYLQDIDHFRTIEFARDPQLGFMTAGINEIGGFRLSAMLHTPGLFITDHFEQISKELAQSGIRLEGLFGTMRPAPGAIISMTHMQTSGLSEDQILESMESAAMLISRRERATRRAILQESRVQLEDMIARAYGLTYFARSISLDEYVVLHSSLRLGVDFGWIRGLSTVGLDLMSEKVGPAFIMMRYGVQNDEEINLYRGKIIRETLQPTKLQFGESELRGEDN